MKTFATQSFDKKDFFIDKKKEYSYTNLERSEWIVITLYIDTHSTEVVIALYESERLLKKIEQKEPKETSTVCVPSIIQILEEVQKTKDDISDIVVVNGPGSFTGVRIGITIAKTLAYAKKIPIRTITSLELYFNQCLKEEYLSLPEKNGYFLGKVSSEKIIEYQYLSKKEYEEFTKDHQIKVCSSINYENIIAYAHQKNPLNPHEVNPFYVKKIEVEK